MKRGVLLALVAATVTAVFVQVGESSAGKKKATLGIRTVAGRTLHIPPGATATEDVKCPKNFAAVSADPLPGANDLGYASVHPSLSKAQFLFGNPSLTNTYDSVGEAVCVAGAGNLYIRRASSARALSRARRELAQRLREHR